MTLIATNPNELTVPADLPAGKVQDFVKPRASALAR